MVQRPAHEDFAVSACEGTVLQSIGRKLVQHNR
jgi:hypothetical protein